MALKKAKPINPAYRLTQAEWVPASERGFWYKGVRQRIRLLYWKHVRERMVVQLYNTSPLLSALLSNARKEPRA